MSLQPLKILRALAMLAIAGSAFAISTYPQTAQAQTRGMERRDDRRDTRQEARAVKQACKASDEKSNAECRQDKREVKQSGRHDESPTTNSGAP